VLAGCAASVVGPGIAAAPGSFCLLHRPQWLVRPFALRRATHWHAAQAAFYVAESDTVRTDPERWQHLAQLA
jgi:hypothetical protein